MTTPHPYRSPAPRSPKMNLGEAHSAVGTPAFREHIAAAMQAAAVCDATLDRLDRLEQETR